MKLKLILTAALLTVSLSSHANYLTGNDLLSKIRESEGTQLIAIGYIMGVSDAMNGKTHCAPPKVTAGQMLEIVNNFLVSSPELRDNSADLIITKLLTKVWPCEQNKKSAISKLFS